jgi:hypothetical protein
LLDQLLANIADEVAQDHSSGIACRKDIREALMNVWRVGTTGAFGAGTAELPAENPASVVLTTGAT